MSTTPVAVNERSFGTLLQIGATPLAQRLESYESDNFWIMAVGLVAGPVVAGAQARPDNLPTNWADSWKSAVVDPGHVAALVTDEQVNRDSPRLIVAFKSGAFLP